MKPGQRRTMRNCTGIDKWVLNTVSIEGRGASCGSSREYRRAIARQQMREAKKQKRCAAKLRSGA